ncbi:MAG: PilZ domain-containing protein [Pirellulaceae bacterium]|jgi:predicted RNA-binding Zn-ribbon protein involved in translation (DUF1610 family)|nr:PilZ domain-containing protein [Pirellulaceae bacterium]
MPRISLIKKIQTLFKSKPDAPPSAGESLHTRSLSMDQCGTCGSNLPLRVPRAGESGSHWQCAKCGYRYFAVLAEDCRADSLANVRVTQVHLSTEQLRNPGRSVPEFVQSMRDDRERRTANRQPLETNVLATPVNEYYMPIGEPFLARTTDFSATGLAIVHHKPVESDWLVIEHLSPTGESSQVVIKIARSEERGGDFRIGGEFVRPDDKLQRIGASATSPKAK